MKMNIVFENGYQPNEEFPEYIDHWFYFQTEPDAMLAAARLRERGWSANVHPGSGGSGWLTLATQPAKGNEDTGKLWEELTAFATALNGIYDGYERPMEEPDFIN